MKLKKDKTSIDYDSVSCNGIQDRRGERHPKQRDGRDGDPAAAPPEDPLHVPLVRSVTRRALPSVSI